ncbi:MAG: M48 family metalloprotease [Nitrospiraceae bacterium]
MDEHTMTDTQAGWRSWISLARLCVAIAAAGTLAAGCAINPVSGHPELTLISAEQEKEIGAEEAKKVEQQMGLADTASFTPYLETLGKRLAEQSPRQDVAYQFHVADMVEPNAFALPGGYVYVSRGLLALANSEDELAGVVGHEIGHVAARHTVQRISRQGPFAVVFGIVSGLTGLVSPMVGNIIGGVGDFAQSLVFSPYSRSQETEADRVGQEIAARAGWDPAALAAFLATLEREVELHQKEPRKPGFFDSHPATPDRVANTTAHAKELTRAAKAPLSQSRESFLARLDGVVVGQRAANGVFDGPRFLHPDMNFFVQFPDKWKHDNTPQKIVSAAPDGEAAVVVGAAAKGNDPLDGARAVEKVLKTDLVSKTKTFTIGELPAARARIPADGGLELEITWIAHGGTIYQLVGVAPSRQFDQFRPTLDAVVNSFRPLTAAERSGIKEKRLRLVKAQAGESPEALAGRTHAAWKGAEIAVVNSLAAGMTFKDGQVVKIAVEEPYEPKSPR